MCVGHSLDVNKCQMKSVDHKARLIKPHDSYTFVLHCLYDFGSSTFWLLDLHSIRNLKGFIKNSIICFSNINQSHILPREETSLLYTL